MSKQPGREPMTADEIEAAALAWDAENPEAREQDRRGIRLLYWSQDHQLRRRERAASLGITVAEMDALDAERRVRDAAERRAADLARARVAVGLDVAPDRLTVEAVQAKARELAGPDGGPPTQEVLAAELGCTARWLSELCRPHGGYRKVVGYRK